MTSLSFRLNSIWWWRSCIIILISRALSKQTLTWEFSVSGFFPRSRLNFQRKNIAACETVMRRYLSVSFIIIIIMIIKDTFKSFQFCSYFITIIYNQTLKKKNQKCFQKKTSLITAIIKSLFRLAQLLETLNKHHILSNCTITAAFEIGTEEISFPVLLCNLQLMLHR